MNFVTFTNNMLTNLIDTICPNCPDLSVAKCFHPTYFYVCSICVIYGEVKENYIVFHKIM